MERVTINRQVFDKSQFSKTVSIEFTQLTNSASPVTSSISTAQLINDFFNSYESLFFDIPKFGDLNSHQYLVATSGNYLDGAQINESIQLLLDEIAALRTSLLNSNRQIAELQIQAGLNQAGIDPNLFPLSGSNG
jgi:hypothetical protein